MPITININNLTLCHKGSNGTAIATIPDVCKTPAPPGPPVPIPYPNIAMSSDLLQGTTTVSADGAQICAITGSQFVKSTGDEPGVAGGVASSTFIKEATWMLYSFDVILDGQNACRLTDKMFMNHQNTVCMGGLLQEILALIKADLARGCEELKKHIEKLVKRIGEHGVTDKGLEQRFDEQIHGEEKPGSDGWQKHDEQIANRQKELDRAIKKYDEKCGPPAPPIPWDIKKWVTENRPTKDDYIGPKTAPSTSVAWAKVGLVALGVVLTGVAALSLFGPGT